MYQKHLEKFQAPAELLLQSQPTLQTGKVLISVGQKNTMMSCCINPKFSHYGCHILIDLSLWILIFHAAAFVRFPKTKDDMYKTGCFLAVYLLSGSD